MTTFVMMTRLSTEALKSPQSLETLERSAMEHIHRECPEVKWVRNYALLGAWDYLDVFEAPDIETAAKVSTLIRTYGHAHTELWGAIEWARFKEIVRTLPTKAT